MAAAVRPLTRSHRRALFLDLVVARAALPHPAAHAQAAARDGCLTSRAASRIQTHRRRSADTAARSVGRYAAAGSSMLQRSMQKIVHEYDPVELSGGSPRSAWAFCCTRVR